MNRLTLEEFVEYYESNNSFPFNLYCNPDKKLNDKQIEVKYKKYLSLIDRMENKDSRPDYADEFAIVREKVYERDSYECRLWKVLNPEEQLIAKSEGYYGEMKRITPAHFVRRSTDSNLICEEDNIYTLSLMFHSRLDEGRCPLTGVTISKESVLMYWKRIIHNEEVFNKYKDLFLK